MNFYLNVIAMALIFVLAIVGLWKGGVKLKKGEYKEIIPIGFFEMGVGCVFAGIVTADGFTQVMYVISSSDEKSQILKNIKDNQTDYKLIVIGVVICLISVFIYNYLNRRKDKILLNIQANEDNKVEYFKSDEKGTKILENIKEEYVDLVPAWTEAKDKRVSSRNLGKQINDMAKQIKNATAEFKHKSSSNYERAFTAIAPIPLLMYAGYNIPKLGFSYFFEINNVHNENIMKLLDIPKKSTWTSMITSNNFTQSLEDTEVVVAVSTTRRIDESDLIQFTNKKLQIKHIYIQNPSHEALVSIKQVNEYANFIKDEILKIKEIKPNIKVIHLVCASKPSLVFRIGQTIDDTQMPTIISYHYKQDDNFRYPWGIYINYKNRGLFYKWE